MSGRGGRSDTWLDDNPDDYGVLQGGGRDVAAGSRRSWQGGPKNDYPVVAMPSTRDLPPITTRPAPLGHAHVYDREDDNDSCLICGKR